MKETKYVTTVRLCEGGIIHSAGDELDPGICSRDRLLFLLLKEWVYPVGGYDNLPDDLFLDFMEKRD